VEEQTQHTIVTHTNLMLQHTTVTQINLMSSLANFALWILRQKYQLQLIYDILNEELS